MDEQENYGALIISHNAKTGISASIIFITKYSSEDYI